MDSSANNMTAKWCSYLEGFPMSSCLLGVGSTADVLRLCNSGPGFVINLRYRCAL